MSPWRSSCMMQESTRRSSCGAQAADVGRELLRQHGNGAVGEVDGGAAQPGFQIERRTGGDIMRHIGDVDLQFEDDVCIVTRTASSKSRAVSPSMVTMGRSRKSRRRATSAASRCATSCAFSSTSSGKRCGDVMLADHDLDIDAEIIWVAEDLETRPRA